MTTNDEIGDEIGDATIKVSVMLLIMMIMMIMMMMMVVMLVMMLEMLVMAVVTVCYTFTHSLGHTVTRSHGHWVTHSFIHSLIRSLTTHSDIPSFMHSVMSTADHQCEDSALGVTNIAACSQMTWSMSPVSSAWSTPSVIDHTLTCSTLKAVHADWMGVAISRRAIR